jgi:hypothetical protein
MRLLENIVSNGYGGCHDGMEINLRGEAGDLK